MASALFSRDAWSRPLDSRPGWLAAQSGRDLILRWRSGRRAKIDLTLTQVPMPQLYESHLKVVFTPQHIPRHLSTSVSIDLREFELCYDWRMIRLWKPLVSGKGD